MTDDTKSRELQNAQTMIEVLRSVKDTYSRYLSDAVAEREQIIAAANEAINRLDFALGAVLADYEVEDESIDVQIEWAYQALMRWKRGTAMLTRDEEGAS